MEFLSKLTNKSTENLPPTSVAESLVDQLNLLEDCRDVKTFFDNRPFASYVAESLMDQLNLLEGKYGETFLFRDLKTEVRLWKLCLSYPADAWFGVDWKVELEQDIGAAFKKATKEFTDICGNMNACDYTQKKTEFRDACEYMTPDQFGLFAREYEYDMTRPSTKTLTVAMSKLRHNLILLRPQMKAAYARLANICSFQDSHSLSGWGEWLSFWKDLMEVMATRSPLDGEMGLKLSRLRSYISTLGKFAFDLPVRLPAHLGTLFVQTANFYCLCWTYRWDKDKIEEVSIMLDDLLKEFELDSPQAVELFLKSLKHDPRTNSCAPTKESVETYVDFLFPEKGPQLETTFKGLEDLIMFVLKIKEPENDGVKLLIKDIAAAISKLGPYGYLFNETGGTTQYIFRRNKSAFFRLLEKIELLRAEVFLLELLDQTISLELLENLIDSLQEGLIYLDSHHRSFASNSETRIKVPKLTWLHIKPVAMEAGSVYRSFHAKSSTEDKLRDELFKLGDKIQLLKTEILLEELLDGYPDLILNDQIILKELLDGHADLKINVKSQMESLDQGLIVLRTYLIGPLKDDEKLILTDAESVARGVALFYYSFLQNDITERTVRQISHMLPELVRTMDGVNAKIKETYLPVRRSSRSHFLETEGFGIFDFLSPGLREQLNLEDYFVVSMKRQIDVVERDVEFLRSFLRDIEEQSNDHQDLQRLISSIIQVLLEAEYLVELFVVDECLRWYHPLWLLDLVEDLNLVKVQASEMICMKAHAISIHDVPTSSRKVISSSMIPKIDEVVIDLADEKKSIMDRLIAGSPQLAIVSIVGMPGLGKTTLAWKVYNDPSVTYHFHNRAWCCVSQAYQKRELLLQILGEIVELTDDILEMSEEDLDLRLYRFLRGKRYLIVMDDIWSIEAWFDFQRSFPNDHNGSRILVTSRQFDVAAKLRPDSTPHRLRLFSDDESWELLHKKLFDTKKCPDELMKVGEQIAKSCKGLPLAVVAMAGLLEKTDMKLDRWKQVSEDICSRIADDPETSCMGILELSYGYLPNYLKPCFLYTAVFSDDKDIPVRKLAWLWRAEGFIKDTEVERIEDVAEGYLRDLIGRSLVMPSKRRSHGGVKTCRVHDMLRTLCIRKSVEDNLLQFQNGYDELFDSSYEDIDYGVDPNNTFPKNSIKYRKRRLSICSKRNHFIMSRPSGPHVHSLLYSATSDSYPRCPYDISFIFDNFKLLRVLDLECINMGNSFPTRVLLLVGLRFLALCGDIDSIPVSISRLKYLETLIVKGLKGKVLLPYTLWSMENLRHLHVNNYAAINLQDGESTIIPEVLNLVSLSSPYLLFGEGIENIMRRLLKLRKLRCLFSELRDDTGKSNQFPILNFLTELESLNVLYSGRIALPCNFDFPPNLRKLTLSKFRLPWDCISQIGRLPNLEVLKLLSNAFVGKVWKMKEGEFLKLRFLKLDSLNIAEWDASSDHLPQLQHLILQSCRQLKGVPSGFDDSYTLEVIEVRLCPSSVEDSVRRLQEEQVEMGNELKVLVDRSDMEFNQLHYFCWQCGKEM